MVNTATSNKRSLIGTSSHAQSASILRRRRRLSRCRYGILGLFLIVLIALAACGALEERLGGDGYENFKDAVASDRNYDIYWLGREFRAGALVFEGPYVIGDGIGHVQGGGLAMEYNADFDVACCGSLNLVLYSRPAWDHIQAVRAGPRFSRQQPESISVGGSDAQLRTILREDGGLVAYVLTFDFEDTVVEATAGAADTGPQSPLADRETFLAVMENLRPYPE